MAELTFEQRLHNAIGSQEIENIKARHALWHGMGYSKEEWDTIWYKGEDTTWGHFFGRMVGWAEVWSGSVIDSDESQYTRFTPKCREDMSFSHFNLRATGTSGCHNLASPVIEVAEDGMSARACYLTPGQLCGGGEFTLHDGCSFFYERYGSDFVYDPKTDRWLYFHEQVCPDMMGSCNDGNYGQTLWEGAKEGIFFRGGGMAPNNITEKGPLHHDLCPIQLPQNTAKWPEPYVTLDNDNTYSPNHNNPNK
jgi:hypothetical protein